MFKLVKVKPADTFVTLQDLELAKEMAEEDDDAYQTLKTNNKYDYCKCTLYTLASSRFR